MLKMLFLYTNVHAGGYNGLLIEAKMEIEKQVARYEEKGFNKERAEINALMENAVFAIFRDFPDAFLLFGGATLMLFHESVRHSADLDLLARGARLPSHEEIIDSLRRDLIPVAENLQLGELRFETNGADGQEGRIFVATNSGRRLFRVDLTRFGSVIESEIETHPVKGELGDSAVVKAATKELLLLQKAEAFLLRRNVKARDAYDIYLLTRIGATLNSNLRAHLADAIQGSEIDSESILDRIAHTDVDLCTFELKPILPPDVYSPLQDAGFEPLRNAVKALYEEWL
jgi:predicted nucleotidyltransferase component of viral defense system